MHRPHSHGDVGRFDEWATTYETHWMQRLIFDPIQSTLLDLAASQVPQPRSILDVGCGTGRLLRTASERFSSARLEGVDAAPQMVEQATRLMPTGAPIHFADREPIEQILARASSSHYGVRSLIHELVQSELFRNK